MEFNRVFSANLDSTIQWYALSTSLCGCQPRIFASNKIISFYPNQIQKVKRKHLWRENGDFVPASLFDSGREKDEVYVASLFGICAGLLRQRDISLKSFIRSPFFSSVVQAVNEVKIRMVDCGKCDDEATLMLTPKTSRIQNLQSQLEFFKREAQSSTVLLTPPPTSSSRKRKANFKDLEELERDPSIGPIIKKRCVSTYCTESIVALKEALSPDSLGSLMGYGCLYRAENVKEFIADELAQALDIICSKHHSKEAFELLLSKELVSRRDKTLRVPDWVQLLVKLKTKLPDAAWQIILSYLNIGRSGVS